MKRNEDTGSQKDLYTIFHSVFFPHIGQAGMYVNRLTIVIYSSSVILNNNKKEETIISICNDMDKSQKYAERKNPEKERIHEYIMCIYIYAKVFNRQK